MEIIQTRFNFLSTGFAIFSMFFGAGNIVFPLILGDFAQSQNMFGIFGMILTAVLVPLIGLFSMILFEGDYKSFFQKIGKIPGTFLMVLILCLIGPLAGIPRCITISYSTLTAFQLDQIVGVNLLSFSLVCCGLIFLCTFRPARLLDLLGKFLTPLLLISLGVIVIKGLICMPSISTSSLPSLYVFCRGFLEGYQTMDLLAAFFFCSVVLVCLKEQNPQASYVNKNFFSLATIGSLIAAALLCIVYVAFSTLAAGYHGCFEGVAKHALLGTMAKQVLGPYAGLVVGFAVFFAVLTTEIALTAIFARFLHESVFNKKISYVVSLLITLLVAFVISTLHFDGIAKLLSPVLTWCYPALITLSITNLLSKLYGIEKSKPLFYLTLALTAAIKLLT